MAPTSLLPPPIPQSPRQPPNSKGLRKTPSGNSQDDLPVPRIRAPESAVSHLVTPLRKRATLGKSLLLGDTNVSQFTSIRNILDGSEFLLNSEVGVKSKASKPLPTDSDDFRSTRKARDLSFQCIVNRKTATPKAQTLFGTRPFERADFDDFSSRKDMSNSSFDDLSWIESPGKSSKSAASPVSRDVPNDFPLFGTTFSDQLDPFGESQHSKQGEQHFQTTSESNSSTRLPPSAPKKKNRRTAVAALLGDFDTDDAESVRAASTRTSTSSHSTSAPKSIKSTKGSRKLEERTMNRLTRGIDDTNRPPMRDPSFAMFDFPEATFQSMEPLKSSRRRSSLNTNSSSVDSAFPLTESEVKRSGPQRRRSSLNNLSMLAGEHKSDKRSDHSARSLSQSAGATMERSSQRSNQEPKAAPKAGSKSFDSSNPPSAARLMDPSCQRRRSSLNNLARVDPSDGSQSGERTSSSKSVCSNQSNQSKRKDSRKSKSEDACAPIRERVPKVPSAPAHKSPHPSILTSRRLSMSSMSNLPSFDEAAASIDSELSVKHISQERTRPGQQRRRSSLSNLVSADFASASFAFAPTSPITTSSPSGNRSRMNTTPSFGPIWTNSTFDSDSFREDHKTLAGKKPSHTDGDLTASRKVGRAGRPSSHLQMTPRKKGSELSALSKSKGRAVRRSSLNMAPAYHGKSISSGMEYNATETPGLELSSGEFRPSAQRRRSSLSHGVPSEPNEAGPQLPRSARERRLSLTTKPPCPGDAGDEDIGVVVKSNFGDFAHSIVTKTVEWPSIKARRRKINV